MERRFKLDELIDVSVFQDLQEKLNEIYSFPSAIIDNEGKILTAVAWQDICTKFHRKHPVCEKECIKSDQYILEHLNEANPAVSYQCPHGLVDNATPIIINDQHLGNFFTGQFFLEEPDIEFFRNQAHKYEFDEKEYLEAVVKVPIWTKEKVSKYLDFIRGFIQVIVGFGLKHLKEKENNENLLNSEERFRLLGENSADMVTLHDSEGKYLFYTGPQKYGIQPSDVIGKMPIDFFEEDIANQITEQIKTTYRTGENKKIDIHVKWQGKMTWFEENIYPIKKDDEIISVVKICSDITERKNNELELIRSKEKAVEGENKLQLFFDTLTEGVALNEIVYDENKEMIDYRIIEVNKAFYKIADFNGSNVTGKLASEVYGMSTETIKQFWNQHKNKKETVFTEFMSPLNKKWFYISTSPFLKDKFVTSFFDINNIKKAEQELIKAKEQAEENELQLNAILENSPTGFAINRISTGEVIYVNKAFTDTYHVPVEQCSNVSTFFEYVYSDQMDLGNKILSDVKSEDPERMKWELVPIKDKITKSIHYVSASNIILKEIDLMISTVMDITLRVKNENELKAAKEKAEESDRLKTAFLQNMSHEIRTPLNAISGFSGMLSKSELSEEKKKSFTSIIQNSSKQLVSIVSDILTISSLETHQEKVNIEKVCINNIILDLHAIFKQQATNQNISLYAKHQLNHSESEVFTDKTKVIQVLTNLLTNALKYTHQGFIEFGYNLKNNELEFYVKDSGIGISPEFHEKIFERFQQANDSTNKVYGGTGLGLAISKAFVELLGGKIWILSEINKGSTFYFTIPYTPVNEIDKFTSSIKQNGNYRKVLVAEDEEYNFLFIEELLIDMDLELFHAKNGRETVEIFKANPNIDLILMDIKMPLMTGHEAAKIIKELKPELPIVAQSAYALEHELAKYKGIFDDYITKPIDEEILKQTILKYIYVQKNK